MRSKLRHEGFLMQLPKPKSLPGLLIYGFSAITLLLFGRIAWVLIGQNIETLSTEKGYDKLLSKHWTEIMAWLGENGFWLSLAFAFFLGATIALWINLGLQEWSSKREALSVPNSVHAPEKNARGASEGAALSDPKIAELEARLNEAGQKTRLLAAAEKARLDLETVKALQTRIDSFAGVNPVPFTPDGAPRRAYRDVENLINSMKNSLVGRPEWTGLDEAIKAAVAALSSDPLNYVIEEHERPLFGTNAGKKAFMVASAKIEGVKAFVRSKESELQNTIRSAANLQA